MFEDNQANKGNVLVVDDEHLIRELFNDLLEDEGYNIMSAANADEALNILKEEPNSIDVIFLDIMMPGKTGLEIMEDINSLSPNTAIVIMTAYPSMDYAIEAIKKGVYDFLKKPLVVEQIKLVLRNAIEKVNLKKNNTRLMEELKGYVVQLEELNERLAEIDKTKSSFISEFSYNLKTPLTVISGYMDLLLVEDNLDKGIVKEYLTTIKAEADKLHRLLHSIILCSKLEMGKVKPYVESFDIKELLKDVFKTFKNDLARKSIPVSFKSNHEKIMFKGDKNLITEMFEHLVSNAIKFNKQNGKIEAILYKTDDNLSVSLKDTGFGIKQNHLHRIFEKFYMVMEDESQKSEGLGLGLSIVQEIAALHSGQIYVKSEYKEGTIIKIDFLL